MSAVATFDALARVLAEAQQRFGEAAFRDRRRLIGLLADHVPEAKREIRAVGTAVDEGVPASVITTALYQRFESRDLGDFTAKVLSAMRKQFGGHHEKKD